jgi:hypothetical protein
MATTAILRNWNDTDRKTGAAWITLVNANGDNTTETVTVAKGQSARAALEAAGWTPASGVRRNSNGEPTLLFERMKRPGLQAANVRMSQLLAPVVTGH